MVKVKEDLAGRVFGRLTVLEQAEDYTRPDGRRESQWLCQCNCSEENFIIAIGTALKSGKVKSCGCIHKEFMQNLPTKFSQQCNDVTLDFEDEYGKYGIGLCHNTGAKFYFDMDDYELIKDYCWSEKISNVGYHSLEAWDKNEQKVVRMSKVLGCEYYDHEDRNPLNNRRYNLRPATKSENAQNHKKQKNNTSGFTGVTWDKQSGKWLARISLNGKRVRLGLYGNITDAIIARLRAEQKYYGEFSPQKHLFEQYGII